jgi:SAM-dependent methyltransferase
MDVRTYNREMWNKQVENGNPWTIPVSPEVVAAARGGDWSVLLTEQKPVPRDWFPADMRGVDILGLACGGGQQGPIFAAAGGRVTVFDNSPRQLAQDRMVAERDGLEITIVEGDMRDLSYFSDESFDLVFHPVSNCFCPEVVPVWREAYRVLRPGGILLAGFNNPVVYIFDFQKQEQGIFEVRYSLPFDARQLNKQEILEEFGPDLPIEFSHSLETLIGGQLEAGFVLTALYEDTSNDPLGRIMPSYIATRALKLDRMYEDSVDPRLQNPKFGSR